MSKISQTLANAKTVPPQAQTHPGSFAKESSIAIPKFIGEYRVDGLLGKGGMGYVYSAFDPNLQRKVAIKTILPTLATDEEIVERFLREARMVAQLSSDSICHIYSLGRLPESDLPYFVMEFIEGTSLQEKLHNSGTFAAVAAVEIIKEAATALNIAYEKGIIHRDIKPANIMIELNGSVKVTDFGLAKLVEGGQELTGKDVIVGTPHYMAPECALGEKCDHRADIYSLGATLFHMVAGRVPFDGPSALSVLNKHANSPIPPLREINASVPQRLVTIVERMLAKKPEDRFSNYDELLAAFGEFERKALIAEEPTVAITKPQANSSKLVPFLLVLPLLCAIAYFLYPKDEAPQVVKPPTIKPTVATVTTSPERGKTSIPADVQMLAQSPLRKSAKGAVHLFLLALHLFSTDEEKAKSFFPLLLPKGEASSRSTWFNLKRLRDNPHWIRSYLGGTPKNGYECKELLEPLFDDRQSTVGEGRAKVFVWSSGRDLSVPVTLRRNNEGHWKVFGWSSLAMGVKKATVNAGDF